MAGALDFAAALVKKYPAFTQIMKIPDVAQIFGEAMVSSMQGKPWDPNVFTSKVQATDWFRTTPAGQRQWLYTQLMDPASANHDLAQQATSVVQIARTLGVAMDPASVNDWADKAMANGWDAAALQAQLASHAQSKQLQAGTITATQTALRGIAGTQGFNISDHTAFDWSQRIADGQADQKGFEEYARQQAALSHPYWEKQINQGLTVRQLADPYIQTASSLLEVSPDSINLADHKWDFTSTAKDGTKTPLGQSDWANRIMSDGRYGWDKTTNAKQAAYQVVDNLRQSFGAK